MAQRPHPFGVIFHWRNTGVDSLLGMGKGKIVELFDTLLGVLRTPDREITDWYVSALSEASEERVNALKRIDGGNSQWMNERTNVLNKESLAIPLSSLHIGPKVKLLAEAELHTLGDLISQLKIGLPPIRSFGVRTFQTILRVLNGIAFNVKDDGSIDWVGFSSFVKIPLIPDADQVNDGRQFLGLMPNVISQLVEASVDDIEKIVLTERLTKPVAQQRTLEELGAISKVSREYIRQKEKNLLASLSNGLLYDEYSSLEYRFSSSFAGYFRQAANAFMDQVEVTFEAFVKTLSELWDVSISELIPNMPFITAILTNKPMTPKALRLDKSIPPGLLVKLPKEILEKPLIELPLERFVDEYHKHHIFLFGNALELVRNKRLPIAPNRRAKKLLERIFISVEKTLESYRKDQPFWLYHDKEQGKVVVPPESTNTAIDFLKTLKNATRLIVKANSTYKWSLSVYDLRVSQPKQSRLTLNLAGQQIGISGHSVGRIEKRLISILNDQLIKHDFTESKVYLRECFLAYWEKARVVYTETKEFTRFKFELARKWGIPVSELDEHADLIWTVIHLYPHGVNVINRKRRKEAIASGVEANGTLPNSGGQDQKPQIIKLRGFKRVY